MTKPKPDRTEYFREYYWQHRGKLLAYQVKYNKSYRRNSEPPVKAEAKTAWTRSDLMNLSPQKLSRAVTAIAQRRGVLV